MRVTKERKIRKMLQPYNNEILKAKGDIYFDETYNYETNTDLLLSVFSLSDEELKEVSMAKLEAVLYYVNNFMTLAERKDKTSEVAAFVNAEFLLIKLLL